jgi:hypothetical protein
MFIVEETGRIVHANVSGYAMLDDGSVLRAACGKLVATDTNAASALNEIFAMAGGGDAALGTKGIAVPLTARDGERHIAHVLPLTSGARRRAGCAYSAAAALFVHKAALDTQSPPEVIARTFKLTPTELRVLLAIVQVGGVPETAEALGVAFLFSFTIGTLCATVIPRISPRLWRQRFPINWVLLIASLFALAMVGAVITIAILTGIGYIPAAHFAGWLLGSATPPRTSSARFS